MENAIRTGRIIIIVGTVVQKDRAEKRTLSDCGKPGKKCLYAAPYSTGNAMSAGRG